MSAKTDLYSEFLRREGYVPENEANGDVRFKAQGETYVVTAAEDDPNYFKLSYFHRWSPEQTDVSWRLINALNAHLKVVKIAALQDVLCITTETFLKSPEDFSDLFPRCLNLIQVAKANLASGLQQIAAQAAQAAKVAQMDSEAAPQASA